MHRLCWSYFILIIYYYISVIVKSFYTIKFSANISISECFTPWYLVSAQNIKYGSVFIFLFLETCRSDESNYCWDEHRLLFIVCLTVLTSHCLLLKVSFKQSAASLTTRPFTYLKDLGEEARANLLTEEVVDAGQAGHGAPQGSVRGRADPVGSVDAVERRLIWAAVPLLRITEAALSVVVHGVRGPPRSGCSTSFPQGNRNVC